MERWPGPNQLVPVRLGDVVDGGARDPACALNLVRDGERDEVRVTAAISNSFAFGGTNSVLVFTPG